MTPDDNTKAVEESIGLLSREEVEAARGGDVSWTEEKLQPNRPLTTLQRLARKLPLLPQPSADRTKIFSVARCLDLAKSFFLFLLPSVITALFSRTDAPRSPPRPTAYLDGLRGVAAWVVVNHHLAWMLSTAAAAEHGWGNPTEDNHEIYKLPFLRVSVNGNAAVSIFFIISGYALSISPVLAMRKKSKDRGAFMTKLASSILRRPIRLYLPVWAAYLIVFTLVRIGFFKYFQDNDRYFHTHFRGPMTTSSEFPRRTSSFWEQFITLVKASANQYDIFQNFQERRWMSHWDTPSWTILVEFRASLALYLTHAALFLVQRRVRVAIVCALVVMGAYTQGYDVPLFWIGFLMAELSPIVGNPTSPALPSERGPPQLGEQSSVPSRRGIFTFLRSSVFKNVALVLLMICGLYLVSIPAKQCEITPGFILLTKLSPWGTTWAPHFWGAVGSMFIIITLDRVPFTRRLLLTPLIQYLGKISFSFYLCHMWLLHTLAMAVFHYSYSLTGTDGEFRRFAGFLLGYLGMWVIFIWASDLFQRTIDSHSTSLGFKLEKWLFEK